jgi:hypothetical protein
VITKTTADHQDDNDSEVEKKTRAPKKRKTTIRPTTITTKIARNRVTLPISAMVENTDCTFQGNMPDPDNCQCKDLKIEFLDFVFFVFFLLLAYYTCREDVITRVRCLDRQLFDEDTRLCNDYRKVFCGNRPTNDRGNDPCKKNH